MRELETDFLSETTMRMRCLQQCAMRKEIYYDKKREWNKMVDRAMAADFSWGNSARQYEEMYNWLIGDK